MEWLRYPLASGASVNLWWTNEVQFTPVATADETFEAEVNLHEAYVQIVYPVRAAFLKSYDLSGYPKSEGPFPTLHFPDENNRLDFSTFIHTPHCLAVDARTWIEVDEAGEYPFDIYTCGAVKLWVDDEVASVFTPFTRNIPQRQRIFLQLEAGRHEITVHLEELAERDVFFYLELRYLGSLPLAMCTEVDHSVEELKRAMELLRSLHYERQSSPEGSLTLCWDEHVVTTPLSLMIDQTSFAITPLENRLTLPMGEPFTEGVHRHTWSIEVGPYHLTRDLVTEIVAQDPPLLSSPPTIAERKRAALEALRTNGERSVIAAMVAIELEGSLPEDGEEMIISSVERIEAKEDCSDFHLVPMLLLLTRFAHHLTPALRERIEASLLSYRYWIDEPGSDVMWYFSENHALLFHIGQYLVGQLYPDARFKASGRTGRQQHEIGRSRLEHWFSTFSSYGYAEWNSATYLPIDLIGFLVLNELAADEAIREMAHSALDFTFRLIAHNSFKGIMSSSFGRCYEETVKYRSHTELSSLNWVAYSEGRLDAPSRATALFALSAYENPPYPSEIVLKDDEYVEIALKQGIRGVNTYLFKTPFYQMGSAQRYRPFTHGHQQHLFNVALGDRAQLQYSINHPGEPAYSGENRPSYWAGNGTMPLVLQYRNLAFLLFNTDEEELVHAIHAYLPLELTDRFEEVGHHVFFSCDGAWVHTWFSSPAHVTRWGANTGCEILSPGRTHAVMVRCSSAAEGCSFDEFITKQCAQDPSFDEKTLTVCCTDPRYGAVHVSADSFTVNGEQVSIDYPRTALVKRGTAAHA